MGFYEERPPRHGHRNPSELAEDEMLSSLHGDFCGMPEAVDATLLAADAERACLTHFALLPWDDAHPLISTLVELRQRRPRSTPTERLARTKKSRENIEP